MVESSKEIRRVWISLTDVNEGRVSGKSFKGNFFLLPRYRFKFLYWINLSLKLWDGLLIMTARILVILDLFYCCHNDELATEPCKRISRDRSFSPERVYRSRVWRFWVVLCPYYNLLCKLKLVMNKTVKQYQLLHLWVCQ